MRQLFADLKRVLYPVRHKLLGIILLFLILSLFDLVGVGLVLPFFAVILKPDDPISGVFADVLLKLNIEVSEPGQVLAVAIIAVFLLKTIASIFAQWVILGFVMGFRAQLTNRLMKGYLDLPYSFFMRRNTSEMIQKIVVNLRIVTDDLLLPLFKLAAEMIVALLLLVLLFSLAPGIFLILTLAMGAFGGIFVGFARKPLKRSGALAVQSSEELIRNVSQGFNSIKETKVLGVERGFSAAVSRTAIKLAAQVRLFYTLSIVPKYLMELTVVVFVVSLLGIHQFRGGDPAALLPILATFGFAGLRLIPAFSQFFVAINAISYARHALTQLNIDLKYIASASEVELDIPETTLIPTFGQLEVRNAVFAYDNPDESNTFLGPVSLFVNAGDVMAIIGPSGSGKTTLADLVLRLHQPKSGSILISDETGAPISETAVNALFAYIPQQEFILDDTIEKNITMSWEEGEVDHEQMELALTLSQFQPVVDRLAEGLKTLCGEGGKLLSGGERQRLSIARALYHKRQILVMDEVTSALDPGTEAELIKSFETLRTAGITIIMITHRPSTLSICNRVIAMDDGRMTELDAQQVAESQGVRPKDRDEVR